MPNYADLDTFYVLDIESRFDSGVIVLGEYIPREDIEETVAVCGSSCYKVRGDLMIYTTNKNIVGTVAEEKVVYISPDDLNKEIKSVLYHGPGEWVDGVFNGRVSTKIYPAPESLFNLLFGEGGDYEDFACPSWRSTTASLGFHGGHSDEDLEEALQNFFN